MRGEAGVPEQNEGQQRESGHGATGPRGHGAARTCSTDRPHCTALTPLSIPGVTASHASRAGPTSSGKTAAPASGTQPAVRGRAAVSGA